MEEYRPDVIGDVRDGLDEAPRCYVELPDTRTGQRALTRVAPRVVAGTVRGSLLYLDLEGGQLHPPATNWIEVPGPERVLSEAEYVQLLRAAGVPAWRLRDAERALTPLDRITMDDWEA